MDILKCPISESGETFSKNPWLLTIIENYGVVPEKIIGVFVTLIFRQ
jgi:hypothetical protein